MSQPPSPRQILEDLLPPLQTAAAYAHQIQSRITSRPAKDQSESFFAAALTDADLSVQNLVEVALLGMFPQIRFYGEEHEQSLNTQYFRAIDLGPAGDYLVTLDPIDGTQFYLDGHSNYQIILGVLNSDDFEAVLSISPAQHRYDYALRGKGTLRGNLGTGLEECQPIAIPAPKSTIFLGWGMGHLAANLEQRYQIIDVARDYSKTVQIPNLNGILNGDFAGAVIKAGKFIDGAAIAFLAREAGCIVTLLDGSPLPPLHTCKNYQLPALILATSPQVHQHLVQAVRSTTQ